MSIQTRGSRCSCSVLNFVLVLVLISLSFSPPPSLGLHAYGRWDPEDFFLFLSKFGFQKTELANKNDTQGFIFGNITIVPAPRGGQIARLPSIPPAALIPKSRVPRGMLPVSSSTESSRTNASLPSSSSTPSPPPSRNEDEDGVKPDAVSKVSPFSSTPKPTPGNATTLVEKKIVSSPLPPPQERGQGVVAETSINPSRPPLMPKHHIKFSTTTSTALNTTSSLAPVSTQSSSSSSSSSAAAAANNSATSSTTPTASSSSPPKPIIAVSSSTTSKPSSTKGTTNLPVPPKPPTPAEIYPATLVVLDKGLFIDFYKSRLIEDKDKACKRMFERISRVAHDPLCYPEGTENLFKRIPCPKGGVCPDDVPTNQSIVRENQFTFAISDLNKAKFWYISIVPCYRHPVTCEWEYSKNHSQIDYDIWLVNGNPYTKNQNPLEYQFSFDRQDTVEIYLVFFLCYLILVPLQIHAVLRQRHIVPKLFTASVALELTAVTSNVIHVLKFALDGEGHPGLAVFGDVMDIIARAIFMLILLVLAKGWAVTRTELTSKPFIFSIWAVYGVVHILLYIWKETEVDVIEDIDEYQTWPGWLILILRTLIMIWFLYELKDTMDHEHQPHKLNFFLHFGAAALVWFIYLPIVALIALQVSPLWRSKFLLGITYSADCLAFAIMTHLLWPTRTEQYFLLMSKDAILTDELEEFNEAPHVVNSYVRRPNHWYPVNYSFHDVSSPEAVSLTHGNTLQNFNHQYPHQRFTAGSNGLTNDDVKDNMPLIIT